MSYQTPQNVLYTQEISKSFSVLKKASCLRRPVKRRLVLTNPKMVFCPCRSDEGIPSLEDLYKNFYSYKICRDSSGPTRSAEVLMLVKDFLDAFLFAENLKKGFQSQKACRRSFSPRKSQERCLSLEDLPTRSSSSIFDFPQKT